MFDAAYLPATVPPCDVAAGYVGDAPPAARKWSLNDWRRAAALPHVSWLLPIGVYGPGRNPVADARQHSGDAILVSIVCGFGPVSSNAVALDVEENVAQGAVEYVKAWQTEINRLGFHPVIYTSASSGYLFEEFVDVWLAQWTNAPHAIPGAVATQYASPISDPSLEVDLSTVVDSLPLWEVHAANGGHPMPPQYVEIIADPKGRGYWVAAANGGVFSYGVPFYGSQYGKPLAAPITSAAAAPDGAGYWLLGGDGGVFAFGSARYLGGPHK